MYKGKAIYNPSGKAGEYSYWACNFYVGCSNGCTYCYLKKGRGAKILGGDKPTLKKCFKNESHAKDIFEKELLLNIEELKKHGLFFSFTTDPCLPETFGLTFEAIYLCREHDIPVKILTKRVDWVNHFIHEAGKYCFDKSRIAIGFTLTGHDSLEPNASSNLDRMEAMNLLKEYGFKTFASIEPIIDFESAKQVINETKHYCDLYKIGLESGGSYNKDEAREFVAWLYMLNGPKIYMKESLQKLSGISNKDNVYNFIERGYNIFI